MRTSPLATVAFLTLSLALSLLLTGCTPSSAGGVTSEGYSAPSSMSPIDATESMRSQYRDFR